MTIKTVFMGSPEFALPSLRLLAQNFNVVGVVSQPDREAGRGRKLTPPPVKVLADELNIPTIQPSRIREPQAMAQLQAWAPDLIVVAAFGQILRPAVLDMPRFGCINVHGSLLPRGRGAAPIQAAILEGDAETGITIMKMDPGVDTGPMLAQGALQILPDDNAYSLGLRMAELGANLLVETLPLYLSGALQPQPQPETGATYAAMLKKEDGRLDFSLSAEILARRVRAFYPWPGAYTIWQDQPLKIIRAHPAPAAGANRSLPAGSLVQQDGLPGIACAGDLLVFDEVQPAGKKPMPGKVFLNGSRGWG